MEQKENYDVIDLGGPVKSKKNKGLKGYKPSESILIYQGKSYQRVRIIMPEEVKIAYQNARKTDNPELVERANAIAENYGYKSANSLRLAINELARSERKSDNEVAIDLRSK
jgi:hypothetical protein